MFRPVLFFPFPFLYFVMSSFVAHFNIFLFDWNHGWLTERLKFNLQRVVGK